MQWIKSMKKMAGVAVATVVLGMAATANAQLVGFYEFEGNLDSSATYGTLTGSDFGGVPFGTGFSGQGLVFDGGNNDVVTLPINIAADVATQVTIGGWVNVQANAYQTILQADGDFGRKIGTFNGANAAGGYYSSFEGWQNTGAAVWAGISDTRVLNAGSDGWVFVAASYDNRNGVTTTVAGTDVTVDTNSYQPSSGSYDWLNVGALRNSGGSIFEELNGSIDNVFVIKGAASQAQLESIRDAVNPLVAAEAVGNALASAPGPEQTVKIDFQVNSGGAFGSGNPATFANTMTALDTPETWNVMTGPAIDGFPVGNAGAPAPLTNLLDTDGNATGIGFAITSNVSGYNVDPLNQTVVSEDGFIYNISGTDRDVDFIITGLDPNKEYNITAIGGWGDRFQAGMSADSDGDGVRDVSYGFINSGPNGVLEGLTPDSNGHIIGRFFQTGGEEQVGGLIIEVIPEPSTAMLLLAGAGCVLARRRRK